MTTKKIIFVAFAIEDQRSRDLLKGQSLSTKTPFEFIDMSVKTPYDTNWKKSVRTRIKRSHGVIVLVSKNSQSSSGQKWEINCAKNEGKKILGVRVYTNDTANITGVNTVAWTWDAIANFVDSL